MKLRVARKSLVRRMSVLIDVKIEMLTKQYSHATLSTYIFIHVRILTFAT